MRTLIGGIAPSSCTSGFIRGCFGADLGFASLFAEELCLCLPLGLLSEECSAAGLVLDPLAEVGGKYDVGERSSGLGRRKGLRLELVLRLSGLLVEASSEGLESRFAVCGRGEIRSGLKRSLALLVDSALRLAWILSCELPADTERVSPLNCSCFRFDSGVGWISRMHKPLCGVAGTAGFPCACASPVALIEDGLV